jgi:hypothetical protein
MSQLPETTPPEFKSYTTTPDGKHYKFVLLPKTTPRCFYIMKTLRALFYKNNSEMIEKALEALSREHGLNPDAIAIPVITPKYATLQRLRNVKPEKAKTTKQSSKQQAIVYDPI